MYEFEYAITLFVDHFDRQSKYHVHYFRICSLKIHFVIVFLFLLSFIINQQKYNLILTLHG